MTYRPNIEVVTGKWIRGTIEASEESPAVTSASLLINGNPVGDASSGVFEFTLNAGPRRDTVLDWKIEIPPNLLRDDIHVLEVVFLVGIEKVAKIGCYIYFEGHKILHFIDHVTRDHVYGWALRKGRPERLDLVLLDEGVVVAEQTANIGRGEVADAGHGDGKFGFAVPLPLDKRTLSAELELGVRTRKGFARRLGSLCFPKSDIKVLFVTDTADEHNPSRYYRAVLQSKILWKSGAEVRLISKDEVKTESFDGSDVIVLQRCPLTSTLRSAIRRARVNRALIVYETDDLNTFPELVKHMGSIRSGFRWEGDPNFVVELEGRMSSANIADAIITPNRFMQRYYREAGYAAIVSPFSIEADNILRRKINSSPDYWRLLYMSGSPTHRRDFLTIKQSLLCFMRKHTNVSLTVLGWSQKEDFDEFEQVRFMGPATYADMFKVVDMHDCVLAPFERNPFNAAKSCTKFIEAGARGVPIIVSRIQDYLPHIARTGFGAVVGDNNWEDALEYCYWKRLDDAASSSLLCKDVAQVFSVEERDNRLIRDLEGLYSRFVCGVYPSRPERLILCDGVNDD